MRINVYNTILNDDRIPILVKEKGYNYHEDEVNTPKRIVEMMNKLFLMDRQTCEYAYLLCMNAKCRPIGVFLIAKGGIDKAVISPISIFQKALLTNSSFIVLLHNHLVQLHQVYLTR